MAATVIDVKAGTEDGSISLQLIQNLIQQQQDYHLTYYVVADTISQDGMVVALATGIPRVGSRLYGMICTKVNPRATHTVIHFLTGVLTQLWEVDVDFSTTMREFDSDTPEVNWGGELDKEHLEFDLITGAKITTTAGEPIFTERQVFYQIVSIRRKEDWPRNDFIDVEYVAHVNSEPFYGRPRGTAMMLPIRAEEDTQDTKKIVWVTYEIKFKYQFDYNGDLMEDSWQAQLANLGYQYRLVAGGTPQVSLDKTGHPIKVNLDADGLKLVNTNGTSLSVVAIAGISPFQAVTTGESGRAPRESDIGSTMIITSGTGWTPGQYAVVGFDSTTGSWILEEAAGAPGSTSGVWELQRAPITVRYNRAYYANFNALSLGPYS